MKEKKRFFMLAGILGLAIVAYVSMILASNYTKTRLITRKEDEVKAYYTALYFNGTGEGSAIALDNNVGYVTFNLMNFIDEDVTERDIVYEIATRDNFYTDKGVLIPNNQDSEGDTETYPKIHVLDVWNQPKEVGRDTWKYDFSVDNNTGEVYTGDPIQGSNVNATDYLFKYEKLDNGTSTSAVGKTHNVTLKIQRNADLTAVQGTETITVVVQLLKPYKEVFLINMTISERLIVFSNNIVTEFEHQIEELNIQTADIFSYIVDKNTGKDIERTHGSKKFSSNPFKVTLIWTNLIFNEVLANKLPKGVIVTDLNLITGTSGSITLLIPQGSDFKLQFYATHTTYSVIAKVEIYDKTESVKDYVLYDNAFGGYTASEILQKTDQEKNPDAILVLNNTKAGLVH